MPKEKLFKRIHLIVGCITAALVVATGIALILSCLDIYNSGPRPYSAASIAEHFQNIAVLVYVTIASIVAGILLHLAMPVAQKRPKALRDELVALNKQKVKVGVLSPEEAAEAKKEPKVRLFLRLGTGLIFVGLMIYPAIYLLDDSHFPIENLNAHIVKAILIIGIPALVGLLLCFVCSLLEKASIRRESELYKTFAVQRKSQTVQPLSPAPKGCKHLVLISRCIVGAAAVCFILLGIFNGGVDDVLAKAIAICTECIGLG